MTQGLTNLGETIEESSTDTNLVPPPPPPINMRLETVVKIPEVDRNQDLF